MTVSLQPSRAGRASTADCPPVFTRIPAPPPEIATLAAHLRRPVHGLDRLEAAHTELATTVSAQLAASCSVPKTAAAAAPSVLWYTRGLHLRRSIKLDGYAPERSHETGNGKGIRPAEPSEDHRALSTETIRLNRRRIGIVTSGLLQQLLGDAPARNDVDPNSVRWHPFPGINQSGPACKTRTDSCGSRRGQEQFPMKLRRGRRPALTRVGHRCSHC